MMNNAPVCVFVVGTLAITFLSVVAAYGSNENKRTVVTDRSAEIAQASNIPGVSNIGRARTNYALNCQGCHMASGAGTPGRVPQMAGFVGRFLEIDGGREYLLRVPGITNAAISDEELAELTNWMLYRFDPGHIPDGFLPFTIEEIAHNRPHSLTIKAASQRARLLNEMVRLSDEKAGPADRK